MATEDLMRRALSALDEIDGPMSVEVIHQLTDLPPLDTPLTVAQAAELLDISAHSLRYYERIGLVSVPRDAVGQRAYSEEAIRRLVFISRMRLSGMPIRDLQHYLSLVDLGDETVPERLDMLLEHRDTIRRQIRELTLSLVATEYKIANYGGHTS